MTYMEKCQYLLTRQLHLFLLSFGLNEMLAYWQWSWTRLLLKSRAGVGVIYFSRAGHPALQLPLQLLQGTRDSKEGFWSSAFKGGNGARLLLLFCL